MLDKQHPLTTAAWPKLQAHFEVMNHVHMRDMFDDDSNHFEKYSLQFEDIVVDYSKNIINAETLSLLMSLAEEMNVQKSIEEMFSGERINETEDRPVLHVALRNRSGNPLMVDGRDVMPDVNAVLGQMKTFADNVAGGRWKGT